MSSNSGVQQNQAEHQQQFQQQNNGFYDCKECGVSLITATSLEVHLQYHKDSFVKNFAKRGTSKEANNNATKGNMKSELIPNNNMGTVDNSDSIQKKSPEYSGTTAESIFGQPPTPQSYQSGSSPYENQDNSNFSPNVSNYQQKTEQTSPNPQQPQPQYQQNAYPNYSDSQYFSVESTQNQQYSDIYSHNPNIMHNISYRFHPYATPQHYERQQTQVQVSTVSPVCPHQPTPSPSPKQCDKCGYVCESASQLIEHLNMAHPPTPAPHLSTYQPNQHFMFEQQPTIKQEDNGQSEILDLDSHKVVHNVFPEGNKHQNSESVVHGSLASGLINSWTPTQQNPQQQQKIFHQQEQRIFLNNSDQKLFTQNIPENISDNKLFSAAQKLYQPQRNNQDYVVNDVANNSQENNQTFRPFEHLASPPNAPVISNNQVSNSPSQPPSSMQKSSNWKSNEARRPKTYNCTACNKWFTSSGHLKRHYNTTLHKNAVKSSGQPDPASLPISAHHHPARDNSSKQDDGPQSGSSGDEIRNEDANSLTSQYDRMTTMPGLLQQPSSSPYDRQPAPNIHHTPLHSPMPIPNMSHSAMPQHPSPLGNHLINSGLSNGSSPNGEAGLSTTNDSRGLLPLSSPTVSTHGFNMPPQHMMPMENNQFQMYPNELAPHVTLAMDTNSHNTTGEYQFSRENNLAAENQPLPGFENFIHRFGINGGYDVANVGGRGAVTTPYSTFHTESNNERESTAVVYSIEENEYKVTLRLKELTGSICPLPQNESFEQYSIKEENTSTEEINFVSLTTDIDTKIGIMENIKLRDGQQKSPEQAHVKRDYEESTNSAPITPTVMIKSGLHKCYDCDKMFNKACYLTQHNKTFHSGDKPYKCVRCGKRFSCNTIYNEHLNKHAGDKPHKCEQCPKQFNHKTDLRRHMCLHTGQKPYACETCGKGFIRKDHMMKHCETHVRKTQSKLTGLR